MQKTAIVTGGSRGIGLAVARRLGGDGYRVVILSSSPRERYRQTLDRLEAEGCVVHFVQGDIAGAADRARCVAETVERFGRIDVLVNNAGVAPARRADLLEMSEESFERVLRVNTQGTMFMSQLAARQMCAQQPVDGLRGIIVNISSCSAAVSSISRGEYCVSKAGVSMLTQLYAHRLAGEGILVYEVRPGVIDTDMTEAVRDKYDEMIRQGTFPIARWGRPEDVAEAVAAFCAGAFPYSTGSRIDVDGGFHIRRL